MKTRLIYVSSEARIKSLKLKFQIANNSIRFGDYLFLIKGINNTQSSILEKIVNNFSPLVLEIFKSNESTILKIIPEQFLLEGVQRNHIEDFELSTFFKKVVNYFTVKPSKCWRVGQSRLDFSNKPIIMGILNVTPDSFSDGGNFIEKDNAIEHALEMIEAGADIIDIGGESTRPGADEVNASIELQRVIPVIDGIKKHSDVFISVDTYKSVVANEAIEAGAHIINDISGTVFDDEMKNVIDEKKCPVIVMHIKGTPKNMQINPVYNDLHEEVYQFLQNKCKEIETLNDGQIIIDPGIGFGKSVLDNLMLLRDIKDFTFLNKPILIGVSRKSFIGKILETETDKRLSGGLASEIYSYLNGADILRVHDVNQTVQVKKVLNNILAA